MKGKTERLIVTMDTLKCYYYLINRNVGHNAMKIGVLQFCGITPVMITAYSPIKTADELHRKKWLSKVTKLGFQQK